MKIAVYKDRDSKEYKLYESCMFDSKYYNPNFICHIDLPIEKPKEENPYSGEFKNCIVNGIEHEFEVVCADGGVLGLKIGKPKKKLVTKEAQEVNYKLCAVYNSKAFTFPANAKNVRCTYEVEE